jgi:hypothetical protein
MKTYKIQPIISIDQPRRSIRMCAFWRTEEKDYHMSSGFLLEYTNRVTNFSQTLECLDDEHVYRELKALGFDKKFRKLITKLC